MANRIFTQLFSSNEDHPTHHELVMLGREWGWLLAMGFLLTLLGFFAFSMPLVSTVSLTFALAVLLLVSGLVYLVQAVRLRHRHGSANRFLRSALALIVGGLILRFPQGGILGVALALSFYFLVSGTAQWILFYSMRSLNGAGWVLFSSVTSFLLGVYMIITFPFSAIWVPGLLVGIDLAFAGVSMMGWAISLRRLHVGQSPHRTRRGSVLRPSTT
jgi:uncharacterized membrane protein HdeD (DUF308 family)